MRKFINFNHWFSFQIQRPCRWLMLILLLVLLLLSVWQTIDHPGPPAIHLTNPHFTQSPINHTNPSHPLPSWDFSTLINLDNFKFDIINHVCNNTPVLLLILVHSAPSNTEKRTTIRETWGEPTDNIKVLFMVGAVENTETQIKLIEENKAHRDLVQGNFYDAYRNMTYKHVMAFKYAVYYCPQVKYVLKTDDDVFVNIPSFLNISLSKFVTKKLILCAPSWTAPAERSWGSKWRVALSEYPDKNYPPYCPGWVIVYSPDVVFQLYREAQRSQYFWIDDVHITGVLAKRLNLTPTSLDNLVLSRSQINNITKCNSTKSYSFLFGPPNLQQNIIYKLWNVVKEETKNYRLVKDRKFLTNDSCI